MYLTVIGLHVYYYFQNEEGQNVSIQSHSLISDNELYLRRNSTYLMLHIMASTFFDPAHQTRIIPVHCRRLLRPTILVSSQGKILRSEICKISSSFTVCSAPDGIYP